MSLVDSEDNFWDPEMVNDWNDQYSPKKAKSVSPLWELLGESGTNSEDSTGSRGRDVLFRSPAKPVPKTPSKMERQAAKATKAAWESVKYDIAERFFKYIDDVTTGGKIQAMAASTGGVKIDWSVRLNTTAGRAHWRRRARPLCEITGPDGEPEYEHFARIELSTKVLTSKQNLIDTLAHEYCHLLNFMISGIRDQPHGKKFKEWAVKVTDALDGHPEWTNVEVTTKHNYVIDYKYRWICAGKGDEDWGCETEYGRHSRSIDPKKQRCGKCGGFLRQILPVPRGAAQYDGAGGDNSSPKKAGKKGGLGSASPSKKSAAANGMDDLIRDVSRKLESVILLDD